MRVLKIGASDGEGETGPRRMRLFIIEGWEEAMWEARRPPRLWPTRVIFSEILREVRSSLYLVF